VVGTFDDLLCAGKIRYAGLSDVPAWYAARAQPLTEAHSLAPMISLQPPYSLVDRTIEAEHVAAGQALGLGITAGSPLAGGFLTGKYGSTGGSVADEGRLSLTDLPQTDWTDRDWELLNTVRMSALAALDFELPAELRALLDEASAAPPASVYRMFTPAYQSWLVSPGV
jgi:aryl-alcohol dehydrogenase-like predicted oxidoreductase